MSNYDCNMDNACGSQNAENEQQPDLTKQEQYINSLLVKIEILETENERLLEAFHTAIRRPLGVVPACGDEFYDQYHPALRGDK